MQIRRLWNDWKRFWHTKKHFSTHQKHDSVFSGFTLVGPG
jgi:hypothetical protein